MKFKNDVEVTIRVPAWKANRLLAERVIENPGIPPEKLRAELEEDLRNGLVLPRRRKARGTLGHKIAEAQDAAAKTVAA